MGRLILTLTLFACAACSTQTTVIRADLTKRAGLYIVGYTADTVLRTAMEDQLASDLRARDLVGYTSHLDIPDITASTVDELKAKANGRAAIGVVVVNEVAADASDSVVTHPDRISPLHKDLQSFYEYSKSREPRPPDPDQQVFAEVNFFVLDGQTATLVWSGTTWSFRADGQGTALRGISELIANELVKVRDTATTTAFDKP